MMALDATVSLMGAWTLPASSEEPAAPELAKPTEEITAESLARSCQAGSRDAFEQLIEMFEKRIFNYLLKMTYNPHDAEDLTQDTFVKAFRAIDRFNPECSFSTWLFTIAKRTALNHFRSARRVEKLEPYDDVDLRDPSHAASQSEESASLWQLARQLKPQQYEALWLRYGEGFSVDETARIMGGNAIYTKVILHRARAALEKKLRLSKQFT